MRFRFISHHSRGSILTVLAGVGSGHQHIYLSGGKKSRKSNETRGDDVTILVRAGAYIQAL